jgi:methyl-accepting chemotaxis protein
MSTQKQQKEKRSRLFVDAKLQGTLLLRVAIYWVCCLVTATGVIFVWSITNNQPVPFSEKAGELWRQFAPGLVVTFAVLPLAIHDIIKLSNRFVGPIVRFRNALNRLAKGEHVEPIHFRKGDFWHDLTEAFNTAVARFQALEKLAQVDSSTAEAAECLDQVEEQAEEEPGELAEPVAVS